LVDCDGLIAVAWIDEENGGCSALKQRFNESDLREGCFEYTVGQSAFFSLEESIAYRVVDDELDAFQLARYLAISNRELGQSLLSKFNVVGFGVGIPVLCISLGHILVVIAAIVAVAVRCHARVKSLVNHSILDCVELG
jgi:hypothetical protein